MPASLLAEATLDFAKAEQELEEYRLWLDANQEFTETTVVQFLKSRVNLCLLIQIAAGRGHPNRYKREFNLVGVFRADLVVGSTSARHFRAAVRSVEQGICAGLIRTYGMGWTRTTNAARG